MTAKKTSAKGAASANQESLKNLFEVDSSFRDILLLSNDWVWEIDTEGRFTFTSGQIREILGYEPEEVIGKRVSEIFDPISKDETESALMKIISQGKPIINRVNWNIAKGGRKVCLVTNGLPIFNEKKEIIGYRGVDKDITREKVAEEKLRREIEEKMRFAAELEQAKEKVEKESKTKTLFLTKMSNEVRTPLNGIIGTSTLLKETRLDFEQREFLDIIEVSANNLLSIINDILDISKIEAGNINIEKRNFNLIEVLNEIERLLSFKAREKRIGFSVEIKPGFPKYGKGDPFRLKQVLINFTNNAIKFTKQGSVKIVAEKLKETKKSVHLKFSVVDTGVGISEERQKHLLDDYNNEITIKRKPGGTGLGLLISKKIVDLLNGEIGFESTFGKGSTFWFSVILDLGDQPQPKPMERPSKVDGLKGKKLSILVVEDNVINQKVVMVNLKQLGHDVEIAVNGKMAVELFKNNKYDLILMDIQMPVMDGLTATREIRRIEKENKVSKNITIIAVTANAMKEDRDKCMAAGMDDYITKPFKTEDLEIALRK